jgi:hypothetical protein
VRVRTAGLLLALHAVALAGCPASPGLIPVPRVESPAPLDLYDDLTSASLDGVRWEDGQFRVALDGGGAVLEQQVRALAAGEAYRNTLVAIPPPGGQVTSFFADVTLESAVATGDTELRAGIELVYQPEASRLQRPYDQGNQLQIRIVLLATGTTVRALRRVHECAPGVATCQYTPVGYTWGTGASWPDGTVVSANTRYTLGISVDPPRGLITLTLTGGGLDLSQLVDVSSVTTTADPFPPFVPELSSTTFLHAGLVLNSKGGTAGGGDGAARARFDDVRIGMDGAAPVSFDDFGGAGTRLDPARWSVGGAGAESTAAGLRIHLDQADAPATAATYLTRTVATALEADVTVEHAELTGGGRIAAELRNSLYNDGSHGSGAAPDVNAPASQVGDVVAVVGMTGTEAFHAVVRCDSALCARFTWVESPTAFAAVTPGSLHTLSARWDAARHLALFGVDGAFVGFDPVAAGHPIAGAPGAPCKRLAVDAGPAGPGAPFTAGSAGALTATFANVRTD